MRWWSVQREAANSTIYSFSMQFIFDLHTHTLIRRIHTGICFGIHKSPIYYKIRFAFWCGPSLAVWVWGTWKVFGFVLRADIGFEVKVTSAPLNFIRPVAIKHTTPHNDIVGTVRFKKMAGFSNWIKMSVVCLFGLFVCWVIFVYMH